MALAQIKQRQPDTYCSLPSLGTEFHMVADWLCGDFTPLKSCLLAFKTLPWVCDRHCSKAA